MELRHKTPIGTASVLAVAVLLLVMPTSTSAASSLLVRHLDQRTLSLEGEIRELSLAINSRRSLLATVRAKFDQKSGERDRLKARLEKIETKAASANLRFKERAVAIYRAGRLGSPRVLGADDTELKALRMARYMLAVVEQGRRSAEAAHELGNRLFDSVARTAEDAVDIDRQARDLAADLGDDQRDLEVKREELSRLHLEVARLDEAAKEIERRRLKAVALVAKTKAHVHESASASRRENKNNLAADKGVVGRALEQTQDQQDTGPNSKGFEFPELSPPPGSNPRRLAQVGAGKLSDGSEAGNVESSLVVAPPPKRPDPEKKLGFTAFKGQLIVPIQGPVVARFGQLHRSGVRYRGLIIRGRAGDVVRAAVGGQVVFSGQVPGLGAAVIVAHDDRYHSVYGRMESSRVVVGQRLASGDALGDMRDDDGDLHFEMRVAGKPFDPLPWFKGGRSAFHR